MSTSTNAAIDTLFERRPDLTLAERDFAEFRTAAAVQSVDAGSVMVPRGAECRYLPFVLRGSAKVR